MKKGLILLIILYLAFFTASSFAKTAKNDYEEKPVPQILRGSKPVPTSNGLRMSELERKSGGKLPSVNVSPYKDNNEKLYAVVGKTQLIKFDEPVKRISITDPSLADLVLLSPNELLLNGKKAGRTSLLFWGSSEKPIFFNMVVQQDTDAFMQAVNQIAPGEDIKYSFTDDGVILSGKISSTAVKKSIGDVIKAYNFKVVDLTESPTKQVLLEVKITEASRTFSKSLSSQFGAGQDALSRSGISFGNITEGGGATFNSTTGQFVFSAPSSNIAWSLSAAESKGLIKILAEPKLLAIDGQAGSFNVGQEIPYPSSVGMSSTTSYSFKNTGVILNFTPTILEKSNRVVLKLAPEVSEIDKSYTSSVGVPGFKTRKVDTTVELADGETLVIAGLLSHTTSSSDSKIPTLGDIPGIGFLFSNLSREKTDTELVIFITPRIVDANQINTGMEL